jgi:hypothetical protein
MTNSAAFATIVVDLLRAGAQDMTTAQRLAWKDEALRTLADFDDQEAAPPIARNVVVIGDHDPDFLGKMEAVRQIMESAQ